MRELWEITEQIVLLIGLGIVAIQVSFIFEYYVLASVLSSMLILAAGVLMMQFYVKKRR